MFLTLWNIQDSALPQRITWLKMSTVLKLDNPNLKDEPDVVLHAYNPCTKEADVERWF